MRNKLPVVLAIAVATQWAPLMNDFVKAEDQTDASDETADTISAQLQDQEDPDDILAKSTNAEKKYLNQDTNLLMNPQVPSATSYEGKMRDTVYILDEENEYVEISDQGETGWVLKDTLSDSLAEIFDDVSGTMYVNNDNVSVYTQPDIQSKIMTTLNQNDPVTLTGTSTDDLYRINVNNQTGYIDKHALSDHALTFADRLADIEAQPVTYTWSGAILNPSSGSVIGPSGKETYYNLDMSGVISVMRSLGYDAVNYPYWIRADGAKMLGPYVMVAADLSAHPKGSIIDISLGQAIVADTGGFVNNGSGTKVDVAVTW